jgi:hypothetical protein
MEDEPDEPNPPSFRPQFLPTIPKIEARFTEDQLCAVNTAFYGDDFDDAIWNDEALFDAWSIYSELKHEVDCYGMDEVFEAAREQFYLPDKAAQLAEAGFPRLALRLLEDTADKLERRADAFRRAASQHAMKYLTDLAPNSWLPTEPPADDSC